MKNGNISVAFEKCLLKLDDFERQKGPKVVFLFFYARVYIFGVELYPWKWYFEPYGLCVLGIQKKRACCAEKKFVEKNIFLGY